MRGTSEEQKVRIVLWLVVCSLLRTDKGSHISKQYVKPLENLSRVSTYDSTELGYCSLCLACTLLVGSSVMVDRSPSSVCGDLWTYDRAHRPSFFFLLRLELM